MKINEKYLGILRRSLGLGMDGSGREYRNYYAAVPDNKDCKHLEKSGYLVKTGYREDPKYGFSTPGLIYYQVTNKGRKCVRNFNQKPAEKIRQINVVCSICGKLKSVALPRGWFAVCGADFQPIYRCGRRECREAY